MNTFLVRILSLVLQRHCIGAYRAIQSIQDKAQGAGNGYSLDKACNAVLDALVCFLRATHKAVSHVVVFFMKGYCTMLQTSIYYKVRLVAKRFMNRCIHQYSVVGVLVSITFFSVSLHAAVLNDLESMSKIQLAMLDITPTVVITHVKQKKLNKTPKKKTAAIIYPANCLDWSAAQVNRKATDYQKPILTYSRKYRVDSNLVKSIITAESCFKVKALSNKGARGLMQLIPDTAKRFGVTDIYSAEQNIRGGTKYLKFLLDRYKGNLSYAIAAYNAGEGAVDKYKGVPPYKETKNYVKNVLKVYRILTPKKVVKKKVSRPKKRVSKVKAVYRPPKLGRKPGRHGWQYNRRLAPHLYKH